MLRFLRSVVLVMLLALVSAAGLSHYLRAREREQTKPAELFDVIWRQVTAFRERDYPSAYRQVSMNFQERFNMEAFTDLIHSDFPPLRMADRVEFGAVRWEGDEALVPAYFFLPDREVIPCLYTLVREDGRWKIESVDFQRRWRPGRRLGGLRT